MGLPRVLRRRLRSHLSREPFGQDGRLQALRSPGHPDSRRQRQLDLLPANVRPVVEAAVPPAQRLSGSEGHPELWGAQRALDDRAPVVLSHRSAGNSSARSGSSRTGRRRSFRATRCSGRSRRSSPSADDAAGRGSRVEGPAPRPSAAARRGPCSSSPSAVPPAPTSPRWRPFSSP